MASSRSSRSSSRRRVEAMPRRSAKRPSCWLTWRGSKRHTARPSPRRGASLCSWACSVRAQRSRPRQRRRVLSRASRRSTHPRHIPLMPPEVMRDWTALSSSRRACRAAAHLPLGAAAAAAAARTLLVLRTIRWRLGRWRFARRLRVAERKHNGLMVLGRKHHGLLGQQHSPSQRRKPQCRVVSLSSGTVGSSDTKFHSHRDRALLSTRNPPHKPPSNAKGVEAKGKSHEEWL